MRSRSDKVARVTSIVRTSCGVISLIVAHTLCAPIGRAQVSDYCEPYRDWSTRAERSGALAQISDIRLGGSVFSKIFHPRKGRESVLLFGIDSSLKVPVLSVFSPSSGQLGRSQIKSVSYDIGTHETPNSVGLPVATDTLGFWGEESGVVVTIEWVGIDGRRIAGRVLVDERSHGCREK
jgi:hypothetical protein